MSEPVTRDPEQTRARILDAAEALFVDQGFDAISMRQIAAQSGVTKSLIHHHFGTKERLWEEVKARAFATYAEEQMSALQSADDPDPELLRQAVLTYFQFLRQRPEVVRLFAWTHLEGDTTCGAQDRELVALGAERIRQAQERGLIRADVNPTHLVTIFVMTCTEWFAAASHHAQWQGMGDDDEFITDFLKIFMEGLLPRD